MQCEVLAGLGSLCIDAAMLWIQDEHVAMLPFGRALRAACIRLRGLAPLQPPLREHPAHVIEKGCLQVSSAASEGVSNPQSSCNACTPDQWMAYGSHVVYNDVSALHIHARYVGHNPVQEIAELGVVRAGCIRVHLQREESSAQPSTRCACL